MKKFVSLTIATVLSLSLFAGCTSTPKAVVEPTKASETEVKATEAPVDAAKPTEKQKIVFWSIHKGEEFAVFEKAVAKYNAQSDKYVAEALSVTDKQKLIVSIANNDGPDLIGATNQDLITYTTDGLVLALDEMIAADNFDMKQFSDAAIKANTIDGKIYALPWHVTVAQLFYNADLLKELGYDEAPKTMEELYEIAVKGTKVDANGDITTMGYPLFPLSTTKFEGISAFGGQWTDDNGVPTANSPQIKAAWKMAFDYRNKFGLEKVQKYVATSQTNRYTPQDAFFTGNQLFRYDGPWLNKMIEQNNPTLNYKIAAVPGTSADPETYNGTRFETQNSAITINAKNKEGAYDLAKFFAVEAEKDLVLGMGQLPALVSLYDDPDINAMKGFTEFITALKAEKGRPFPPMAEFAKFMSLVDVAADYVANGTKTVDEALDELQAEALKLE